MQIEMILNEKKVIYRGKRKGDVIRYFKKARCQQCEKRM
ncbi:hypothetical protein DFR81_11090 [Garciella nitratireducens]|nr:hypothetical protein DFR81_11090 [Garciella nitratireducens]